MTVKNRLPSFPTIQYNLNCYNLLVTPRRKLPLCAGSCFPTSGPTLVACDRGKDGGLQRWTELPLHSYVLQYCATALHTQCRNNVRKYVFSVYCKGN